MNKKSEDKKSMAITHSVKGSPKSRKLERKKNTELVKILRVKPKFHLQWRSITDQKEHSRTVRKTSNDQDIFLLALTPSEGWQNKCDIHGRIRVVTHGHESTKSILLYEMPNMVRGIPLSFSRPVLEETVAQRITESVTQGVRAPRELWVYTKRMLTLPAHALEELDPAFYIKGDIYNGVRSHWEANIRDSRETETILKIFDTIRYAPGQIVVYESLQREAVEKSKREQKEFNALFGWAHAPYKELCDDARKIRG